MDGSLSVRSRMMGMGGQQPSEIYLPLLTALKMDFFFSICNGMSVERRRFQIIKHFPLLSTMRETP